MLIRIYNTFHPEWTLSLSPCINGAVLGEGFKGMGIPRESSSFDNILLIDGS